MREHRDRGPALDDALHRAELGQEFGAVRARISIRSPAPLDRRRYQNITSAVVVRSRCCGERGKRRRGRSGLWSPDVALRRVARNGCGRDDGKAVERLRRNRSSARRFGSVRRRRCPQANRSDPCPDKSHRPLASGEVIDSKCRAAFDRDPGRSVRSCSIFSTEYITVEWCLSLNCLPISGKERSVSFLQQVHRHLAREDDLLASWSCS